MLYRTKKYLKKAFFYVLTTTVLAVLYIDLAHRQSLPAFFEYYTGKWVRENTEPIFLKTFKDTKKPKFFHPYDLLDIITREEGYLGAKTLLKEAHKMEQNFIFTKHFKELISWVVSEESLLTWLKNPQDRFAMVYQWDFVSRLQDYPFVESFCIRDKKKQILYKTKGFHEEKLQKIPKNQIHPLGFVGELYEEKNFLGTIEILWNRSYFGQLVFQNQAGYHYFFVKSDGSLVSPLVVPEDLKSLFSSNQDQIFYKGPYRGSFQDYRVVADFVGEGYLLVFYKKALWYYYFFYFFTFFSLIGLLYLTYRYFGNLILNYKKTQKVKAKDWLEDSFQRALEINQEALGLAQNSIGEIKNLQGKLLELATAFYQGLTKPIQEVKTLPEEKSEKLISPSKPLPKVLEQENPKDFSVEVIKEIDLPLDQSYPEESANAEEPKTSQDLKQELALELEQVHFPELEVEVLDEFLEEIDDIREPLPPHIKESKEIVDEFKETGKLKLQPFLQLRENLEAKVIEVVQDAFMSVYPEDSDFVLLSVDGNIPEEVKPVPKEESIVEVREPFLFEDEDIENMILDNMGLKNKKEKIFFEYHLPYETPLLEIKRKPLILQEEPNSIKAFIKVKKDHEAI